MMVPFLMFHSISENSGPAGYRLPPEGFRSWLGYLRDEGIRTPTLSEYLVERETVSGPPATILTFDDGWKDNVTAALPLLAEFGFKAVFFPSVSLVGTEGMMGWDDLRALLAAGMEVGSHGMSHDLLTGRSAADLFREAAESKRRLEEQLNTAISFFALPRGYLPPHFPALVRRAGYRGLCASRAGANAPSTDPYHWRRYPVRSRMTARDLRAIVRGAGFRWARIYMEEKIREGWRLRHRR
jgi:peptidoglycan/xylan/chitin deacetylase (PgdA/CDA1 family)